MNPLMIAALVFQAASMFANRQGQDQVNDFRKKYQKEADERRKRAYESAESARVRSVEGTSNTNENADKAAQERTAKYIKAEAPATTKASLISPEARGSSAVVQEEGRQKGQAKTFTRGLAQARGRLDGLGDVFLGNSLNNNANMRDIRMHGDFADSWTRNVLPYQLAQANMMGEENFMLGQLFQSLAGMSAGAAGNAGSGAPGGTPTGSAPTGGGMGGWSGPIGGGQNVSMHTVGGSPVALKPAPDWLEQLRVRGY